VVEQALQEGVWSLATPDPARWLLQVSRGTRAVVLGKSGGELGGLQCITKVGLFVNWAEECTLTLAHLKGGLRVFFLSKRK
jgi:hypothetical protein